MNELEGWPWRPDLCPADLHFTEYLQQLPGLWFLESLTPPSIIHVGTGLHHHVGLLAGKRGWNVLGLTISQAEVDAHCRIVDTSPKTYRVELKDVHDRLFAPPDDLYVEMSLFHLGEIPAAEDQRTNREVIEASLSWALEIVFYTGSYGFPHIAPIIDELLAAGTIHKRGEHKSLVAYGRNP